MNENKLMKNEKTFLIAFLELTIKFNTILYEIDRRKA